MPTYQTSLPKRIYSFLEEMALLYSQVEHDMHVRLNRQEKIGDIEKVLRAEYKLDSSSVRNIYHNLKGKHQGVKELRKTQVKELKATIKSIEQSIKNKNKKKQLRQKDKFYLHQKQRRLAIKKQKLEKLNQQIASKKITLCFGSKKLFKAQYNLAVNGYKNHQKWLSDWQKARSSNFLMVGSKTYASGNQLCRLDTDGNLAITVPPCLIDKFGDKVTCQDIKFRYGQDFINIALTSTQHKRGKEFRNGTQMPVTHRFVKKDDKWYIHTHVELPDIPLISHRRNGAIGVDLNANNIAWSYCDSEGNLKDKGQIDIDLENNSSGQATHILSQAIGKIIQLATKYECPIAIEKLDFSRKKVSLRERGKRYAKILSQFAYIKFSDLVKSKARLAAIEVVEVNPAYSTLIGMTKFMSLYGLNSGTAAALVLARRCLRLSERLPRDLYTLLSPVDDNKHVWSYWARISKMVGGCSRHSFFEMKVRVGVKRSSSILDCKPIGAPIIPSDASALGIMLK